MLFEVKFDQYSSLKKFKELDGGERLLKVKVQRFIDYNIDV
jgi:hypothetical protein